MSDESISGIEESSILLFYGWWQMAVCFFAFLGLLAIWFHLGRKQKDFGQVWLALSILAWSFSGTCEIIFSLVENENKELYLNGTRSIFSLFNSLFILLALPWFRYLPSLLKPLIQSRFWKLFVGLPFLFSLLPTLNRMSSSNEQSFINELDVYYAVLTLIFLGYVLWESFAKRRLKMLAWLSVVCILTTLIAQGYKLIGSDINQTLFSAIFKTSLIMLFFALALSWVRELSFQIIPEVEKLSLSLTRVRKVGGKFDHIVKLSGIAGNSTFPLSQALFNLLLKFAMSRKSGKDWLEIKPKNDQRTDKQYDINDHNEIRRLNIAILEGVFGKGNWTKDLHEIPLKSTLFETADDEARKVRLSVSPDHIRLSEDLTVQTNKIV
ncbi:hypothetical protein [Ekhidna sp.]|uniref:hypothetical protein n=1 Tax=Ekhidna sp. TaxID=2608089 RepID=UPI0032999D6D